MRRLILICLLPGLLAAEDHWVKFTSGPYEVLTDAGPRVGRETMVRFEEFRHAIGQVVGEQDLETQMPIRVLVFKNGKGWTSPEPVAEGRAQYAIALEEKGTVSPAVFGALTRLFLQSNTARMPPAFEHGLIEFFSTFDVTGIHITVGAPPPHPDLDWARVHLLVVDPEYFGKLRVLLYNLRKGVDEDPAYRNAYGKPAAEIEARAKQYFAADKFPTGTISSLAMSEKDFPERAISDGDVRLARADLLAGSQSEAEYKSLINDRLKIPEAEEGLGILALRDKRQNDARIHFANAMHAESTSARAYIEYAKLERDDEKAMQALLRAAGINPKLDEPFALMAERDTDPQKRLAHWKAAAERNPRNASYWQALAESYLADHNYQEATKAWKSGEQAAIDPAQRARMRQAWLGIEQQRLDYEEAEKKRQAEEEARAIEKLKEQARTEIHALEAKYRDSAAKPDGKVMAWSDFPTPSGKLKGTLKQVDCIGSQARLVVVGEDNKTVKLLVTDPNKIAITGGERTFGCGPQKARHVTIEYFPKTDARLATMGEVATIEFQ